VTEDKLAALKQREERANKREEARQATYKMFESLLPVRVEAASLPQKLEGATDNHNIKKLARDIQIALGGLDHRISKMVELLQSK
jgi:hypothetical protein